MEELLRRELGCGFVKATGHSGGGCISQGQSYDTDQGRVFVKVNSKAEVGPRRAAHVQDRGSVWVRVRGPAAAGWFYRDWRGYHLERILWALFLHVPPLPRTAGSLRCFAGKPRRPPDWPVPYRTGLNLAVLLSFIAFLQLSFSTRKSIFPSAMWVISL